MRFRSCCTSLLLSAVPAIAQMPGLCPTSPSFHNVWGGASRQVFHRADPATANDPTQHRVWSVADGGLIRHRAPGSNQWSVQSPPSDVTQTLLDVYFRPYPDWDQGWACGVGGHVLRTLDGGQSWQHQDNGTVTNSLSAAEPATLWRVRFAGNGQGLTCGLWTFKHWQPGTNMWQNVSLLDGTTTHFAHEFEFYSLEITEKANGHWTGVCAGQKWGVQAGGCGDVGWVFYTDTSVPVCMNGTVWFKTATTILGAGGPCQDQPGNTAVDVYDPWDIEFEDGAGANTQVGYLVGGTGSSFGGVWRTTDGGRNWNLELGGTGGINTLYGVAAMTGGHALAVGYGGQVWRRDPQAPFGQPLWHCEHGFSGAWCGPVGEFSGPLGGAHGFGSLGARLVGSWGFVGITTDAGITITSQNASSAANQTQLWRFEDLHFVSPQNGFLVGARRTMAKTTDGGLTWSTVPGFQNANGPIGMSLRAITFDAFGRGVAVGDAQLPAPSSPCGSVSAQCGIYYTSDNGLTWQAATSPGLLQYPAATLAKLRDVVAVPDPNQPGNTTFWAVGSMDVSTINGAVPVVLYSLNGGATWSHALDTAAIPLGTVLTGVAFRTPTEGICVGYDEGSKVARAGRIDASIGVSLHTVPVSYGKPLNAIASNGTLTFAVGDQLPGLGAVLRYDGTQFVDAGAPVQPLDLLSISMPPGGLPVLIGAEQPAEEPVAPSLGKILTFDGSTWCTRRALTNNSVASIHQDGAGNAWALGGADGDTASTEFGKAADSVVVRYP